MYEIILGLIAYLLVGILHDLIYDREGYFYIRNPKDHFILTILWPKEIIINLCILLRDLNKKFYKN